jgi:hypothetical protein
MGLIEDANGNPMSKDEETEEAPKNGANGKDTSKVTDIRTVPTGTLFYNLVLVAGKEQGAWAMIQQLEAMKAQQKMVQDPPQLTAMYAEFRHLEQSRFVMAQELNMRFKDFDMAFAARRGIEMFEPGELAEEPSSEDGA